MARFLALLFLVLLPGAAQAQDGRDYLTALLEDNLSAAGRQITITGFEGALSSQAHLDQLTIADDQGIWISLSDVTLDWSRADLLLGSLTINSLSAAEIHLFRLPPGDSTPKAEAGSFVLPTLPVAVNIGAIVAEKVILDEPVLGQSVQARISASLSVSGGTGAANLQIKRTDDGPASSADLAAVVTDGTVSLNLSAQEAAGGVLAQLLGIPNAPALGLTVAGAGPLSDFTVKVDLSSDGAPRLSGDVTIKDQRFSAQFAGDMAPLFAPEYRAFFGDHVALTLDGTQDSAGAFDISGLSIAAQALTLSGKMTLAADGAPERFDLQGRIADPQGGAVLLPLSGQDTRIQSAQISARFDLAKGQDWQAQMAVLGLDRPDLQIANLTLDAQGQITAGDAAAFVAKISYTAEAVQPRDGATAAALGSVIWGDANLQWREGDGVVTLTDAKIQGEDYALTVSGDMAGIGAGLAMTGQAQFSAQDMARFSGLAGRPLSGSARADLAGKGVPLSGEFDLTGQIAGQNLALGIAQVDRALQGTSQVKIALTRDQKGVMLRGLDVSTAALVASASGQVSTLDSHLVAKIALSDLSVLDAAYGGRLTGDLRYDGALTDGTLVLTATGDGLHIGQAQADKLIGGVSQLAATVTQRAGALRLDDLTLTTAEIQASARSSADDQFFDIQADLRNLGLILPEFPGKLALAGQISQGGSLLDLNIQGPGGIDATVKGPFSTTGANDLQIKGRAQAGLINAYITPRSLAGALQFDLRLGGELALQSLSGRVSLANGTYADPALTFTVQGLEISADLAKGRANLVGKAAMSGGGSANLTGNLGMTAPYPADLGLQFTALKLRDPDLYDSALGGAITVTGPLTGGALIAGSIDLGRTEVRVPSGSFSTAARVTGLTHQGDSADSRATRTRAYGPDVAAARTAPRPFALDLRLRAPKRLFIRGRGLTAELEGEIQLRGTTLDVRPSGAFNLVQGRFEFLGKRLTLEQVLLQLEDQLIPTIAIRATTVNNDVTSIVTIQGPAIDPDITLSSSPELPQEEVLAQLLFGQNIQNLSAIQGLQLASAIATLAGKGGDGIVAKIRKRLHLDDLDLRTDETGATTLTAGKYVSDKVYSEMSIAPNGQQEIDLNLTVNSRLNTHIGAATDGNANVGFVIQNNY